MTVISGWLVLTFKTIRVEVNQFEFDFNNLNSKCIHSIKAAEIIKKALLTVSSNSDSA